MSAIPALSAISSFVDDRMNPIVVKEVRQAVRSRFVVAVLMLFLVVQLFALAIYLFSGSDVQNNFTAGREVFLVLQGILLATCLFFVPFYVGIRLGAERSDLNADLLFITTIRPSSIIWGKWLAGMLVAVLIYSACAPFMVLTYLLRGIDLPSIALVLALDTLVVFLAVQLAITLACVPVSGIVKGLVGLVFLGALGGGFGSTMGFSTVMVYEGFGSAAGTRDFWIGALGLAASIFAVMGLLFVLALAMLTPSTANRAIPVRLYLLATWLITGVVFVWIDLELHTSEGLIIWAYLWGVMLNLALLAAISERDDWGPRMRSAIPRRWWLRAPAFVFYSGSAGGVLFTATLLAATVVGFWLLHAHYYTTARARDTEFVIATLGVSSLYVFAYAMLAVLLRWWFLRHRISPAVNAALAMGLAAIGSLVPPLVAFMISPQNWDRREEVYLLANPVATFSDIRNAVLLDRLWTIGTVAAVVVALLAVPWFFAQVRRFKPMGPSAAENEPANGRDPDDEATVVPATAAEVAG